MFANVIAVFQGLGYTIKSTDSDTGFITAESATDSTFNIFFGSTFTQQTAATAFVESVGGATVLRINFVEFIRSSGTYGQTTRQDVPIHDADLYQQALERMENAIFVSFRLTKLLTSPLSGGWSLHGKLLRNSVDEESS